MFYDIIFYFETNTMCGKSKIQNISYKNNFFFQDTCINPQQMLLQHGQSHFFLHTFISIHNIHVQEIVQKYNTNKKICALLNVQKKYIWPSCEKTILQLSKSTHLLWWEFFWTHNHWEHNFWIKLIERMAFYYYKQLLLKNISTVRMRLKHPVYLYGLLYYLVSKGEIMFKYLLAILNNKEKIIKHSTGMNSFKLNLINM